MTGLPPASADLPGHDGELARLVSDTRAEMAVQARMRERGLRQQAAEAATAVGILMDLADRAAEVSVRTRDGSLFGGRLTRVGADFAVLEVHRGGVVLVRLEAVTAVRTADGAPPAGHSGDREPPTTPSLGAYLAGLAPDRPPCTLFVDGEPAPISGELNGAGRDVLTVRLNGTPPVTGYFCLAGLSAVALPSGYR